ncbi:hypothetical protein [Gordonia sp. SL306]|uniref:hypothetical protein n=1 Tax=Gordonia sp. SL306 TaxID=2995145 RepID=UPI002270FEB9|nr:hypothetical protein [Gordonia sp. SL306]WAC56972.1 hypothetical protein OVA31_06925 [Gordonia sp. SL306]
MPIVPITEAETTAEKRAIRAAVADVLIDPDASRVVVTPLDGAGADAYLAQVVAALMISERLDVEVAYAAPSPTRATAVYGLPHGVGATALAERGRAQAVPLIRDDAATVLVGRARHLGADDAKLHGETYVDNERLFTGEVRGVEIEPLRGAPGLRARLDRPLINGRWHLGRAAQTGGTNIVVEREGTITPRVLKRSTFYRHHVDMNLVLLP